MFDIQGQNRKRDSATITPVLSSVMRLLFLSLIILVAAHSDIFAQQLSGAVKSPAGQPLANVYVFYSRSLRDIAETDDRGTFSLPYFETVISFRRAGFRPLTRIVDPSITKLDVVLEDAAPSQWLIPRCGDEEKRRRVGFILRMRVPKESVARKGRDADYENFAIGYGAKSSRVWLSGIAGPYGSLGIPPYAWILDATEFSERSFKAGDIEGSDMRGRLRDGKYWRYVGRLGESIEYSDLTQEQAAYFDRIIDGACTN
jgi:hypothetical protein